MNCIMRRYGVIDVYLHAFLIRHQVGATGHLYSLVDLSPGKEHPIETGYEAGWAPEPISML
jgi:hypothetical protein